MRKLLVIVFAMIVLVTGCSINDLYNNTKALQKDSNTYNLDEESQRVEGQLYEGYITFEGISTIWRYEVEETTDIDFNISMESNSGRAKIILLKPDGEIEVLIEHDVDSMTSNEVFSLKLEPGLNRIRVVAANKAEIKLVTTCEYGEFNII